MATRAVRATKPARKAVARKPAARNGKAVIGKAQAKVLAWFDEHGRAFPWREHRDPYATMVAEVMLQQTQTGRVGPSYSAFIQHFPTLESLARAPAMDVIRAWKGLGYNRRAVDLQRAAQQVMHDFGGAMPDDPDVLRKFPGIGEYSSSAIACFAFDKQVPVVDVNVKRVLSRTAHGKDAEQVERSRFDVTAATWLPDGEAYRWNQALMDIGAMICRPEKPLCAQCPLRTTCRYYAAGKHKRPAAARAPKPPFEGSSRQKRGGIIDALRESAEKGITLRELSDVIHPTHPDRDLRWLVDLLAGLEADGLVVMTPGARKGSPRGIVRFPS